MSLPQLSTKQVEVFSTLDELWRAFYNGKIQTISTIVENINKALPERLELICSTLEDHLLTFETRGEWMQIYGLWEPRLLMLTVGYLNAHGENLETFKTHFKAKNGTIWKTENLINHWRCSKDYDNLMQALGVYDDLQGDVRFTKYEDPTWDLKATIFRASIDHMDDEYPKTLKIAIKGPVFQNYIIKPCGEDAIKTFESLPKYNRHDAKVVAQYCQALVLVGRPLAQREDSELSPSLWWEDCKEVWRKLRPLWMQSTWTNSWPRSEEEMNSESPFEDGWQVKFNLLVDAFIKLHRGINIGWMSVLDNILSIYSLSTSKDVEHYIEVREMTHLFSSYDGKHNQEALAKCLVKAGLTLFKRHNRSFEDRKLYRERLLKKADIQNEKWEWYWPNESLS